MQRTHRRPPDSTTVCPECNESVERVQPTRTVDGDLIERRYIHAGDGPGPGRVCVSEPDG